MDYYDIAPVQYILFSEFATLNDVRHILQKLGMVIIVNEKCEFSGVVTSGILFDHNVRGEILVRNIMNKKAVICSEEELSGSNPFDKVPESIRFIPVLTKNRRVVRVIFREPQKKIIEGRQLLMDVVDACQLKCKYCERGTGMIPNTQRKTDMNVFRKIVNKAKREGVTSFGLYNWTEPLLCRNISEYISIVKNAGLPCHFSSNFSFREIPNLVNIAKAQPDFIIVSISGMKQETYEKYHIGGNLKWVLRNISMVKEINPDLNIILKYIFFDYNQDEIPQAREFAKKLNISFSMMCGHTLAERYEMPRKNPSECERIEWINNKSCPHSENFALDCQGEMYLCCRLMNNEKFRIGNYLEKPIDELNHLRKLHPYCAICDEGGLINIPNV